MNQPNRELFTEIRYNDQLEAGLLEYGLLLGLVAAFAICVLNLLN